MPFANPVVIQDDLLSLIACGQEDQAEYPKLVISRLEAISHCLVNAEAAVTSVTSSTISEFEDIFASLSLEPVSSSALSPTQWLLDNLHNPYPPTAVNRAMKESPELGRRTVNEWFARARQRIGWTRLLRDRFRGCRSAATDAAFRAFVRDDPRSPLDAELHAAFMAVKAHANLVYSSSSPGTPTSTSHLSPPSRSPSATPSLIHSTDSEDSDSDASQPSRKRKRSCSELPYEPHLISPPSRKRRLTQPPELAPRTPPSPSLPTVSAADDTSPPPPSRKRRLSESNSGEPAVKKSRGSDWAPRKQAVSDPLPPSTLSFNWESWCTDPFALPLSATTNHPVPDALDFELFNFEAFPISQPTDTTDSPADSCSKTLEQSDTWLNSLFVAPGQTEMGSLPVSWNSFFNFGFPCQSSPMPSLTNSPSPSSPDTQWSLSPQELPDFESLGSPLFDFSSPSMFKIPALYPAHGVAIVDSTPLIS